LSNTSVKNSDWWISSPPWQGTQVYGTLSTFRPHACAQKIYAKFANGSNSNRKA